MTDKQIIIDEINAKEYAKTAFELAKETLTEKDQLKEYYDKLLWRKEQECEELKDKLNCCFCNPNVELNDIEKQRKCVEVTECFRRQLDQLKAENEELKKQLTILDDEDVVVEITVKQFEEYKKLKAENKHLNELLNQALKDYDRTSRTLAEIKPILELYANSTLGEIREDGSYKIEMTFSDIHTPCAFLIYDPKPAKKALERVIEVLNNDN